MSGLTQSNQTQKDGGSVKQAVESGEKGLTGVDKGAVDATDAQAQASSNQQQPQAEMGRVAKTRPEGRQGKIGEDLESGRADAEVK